MKSKVLFKILILLFFLNLFGCGNQFSTDKMPADFVDVKEIIPTIVLDLRYLTDYNFLGTPVDGYEVNKCVLTRKAATALSKVQDELNQFGLSLKIYDAYRPQRAVDHFVRWAKQISDTTMKREFYPDVDKKNLFEEGYIASKSSHSRGSTVDVTIVPMPVPPQPEYSNKMGQCECYQPVYKRFPDNGIDMGTGFDCFHEAATTVRSNLRLNVRINRLLLKTLMEKHGFRNYSAEWWHYTFVDEPYPDTYFDFVVQ